MLFMVWVGACVPLVCVMVVGVWCLGWCCFQCCVAVVCASRRVPGVVLGFGVWVVCLGVGWLVSCVSGVCACVAWLVCVSWFRMLTCSGLFPVFWLLSFVCLVNNAVWAVGVVLVCVVWVCGVLFRVAGCLRGCF